MSKSRISRGGIAPPQGLIRPARSSNRTLRPKLARSCAAVAPDGPPPTTTTSNSSEIGILPSRDRNFPDIALPYRAPCRLTMNPGRHHGSDDEETRFRGKDYRIRKRRRRQHISGDVTRQRSQEAAETERKRLRRTPQSHANAFAPFTAG